MNRLAFAIVAVFAIAVVCVLTGHYGPVLGKGGGSDNIGSNVTTMSTP